MKLFLLFVCTVYVSYSQAYDLAHSFTESVDGDCMCMKYEIYCQQPNNDRPYYESAEAHCNTLSVQAGGPTGKLANLKTQALDTLVRTAIGDNGLDGPPCIQKYGFWIGLTDTLTEDEYVWSDGDALCLDTWTNWAPDEPNNNVKKDSNGQDCVQLWYRFGYAGMWDDEYCNRRPKGFICEIPDPYCHSA